MMPILAILTCVLVGWVIGPKEIIQEAEEGGAKMGRRALYVLMIRFVCIVLLTLVFMKAFGFFG